MISKKIKEGIKKKAKIFFNDCSGCHDWTHVERVNALALKIGRKERADLDVLEVAVLLHDIGRKEEMKNKGSLCHAEKGVELAEKILKEYKIKKEDIENILHCIETHRYRSILKPKTIEAKVLFDADKLDSLGAIGIARDFLFAGFAGSNCLYRGNEKELAKNKKDYSYTEKDSALLEYEIKLKYIKNKMLTNTGKKLAKERDKFMKLYFKRFYKEIKGEL